MLAQSPRHHFVSTSTNSTRTPCKGHAPPVCNATGSASPKSGVSPHPDALRRRRLAQQRHLLRQQQQRSSGDTNLANLNTYVVDVLTPQSRSHHHHHHRRPPTDFPANAAYTATLPQLVDAQRNAITSGLLTVTYFSAPWCNACRRLQPKIAQLAANNPDIAFIQVSVADDALREFCSTQLHLSKLPYFHIYRRGRLLAHFTANLEKISMLRAEIAALKLCYDPRCESS